MSVKNRIRTCQLLEKMEKNREYSRKLGLSDESTFHQIKVYTSTERSKSMTCKS